MAFFSMERRKNFMVFDALCLVFGIMEARRSIFYGHRYKPGTKQQDMDDIVRLLETRGLKVHLSVGEAPHNRRYRR